MLPAAEVKERVTATVLLHSCHLLMSWESDGANSDSAVCGEAVAIRSRPELEGRELPCVYPDNKPEWEPPAVLTSQEAESGKGRSPASRSPPGAGSLQGSSGSTDLRVISLLREPQRKGV